MHTCGIAPGVRQPIEVTDTITNFRGGEAGIEEGIAKATTTGRKPRKAGGSPTPGVPGLWQREPVRGRGPRRRSAAGVLEHPRMGPVPGWGGR
jgi:hypothetical protein